MTCTRHRILLAVCTRDRTEVLQNCLRSIAKLTEPPASEVRVLMIDNSQAPEVREANNAVVNEIRWPWPITVEHEPELGISFARNRGLEHALALRTDAIVFLDDDQTVPEDWLTVLVRAWREEGADAMKSKIVGLSREDFARHEREGIESLQRQFASSRRDTSIKTLGTGGVLICRRIFDELGLRFDPRFALTGGGDHDFFNRARLRGARLAITHETVAFEWWPESRKNFRAHLRRGFHLGVCSARLREVEARSTISCLRRGLWFVLSGLLMLPASIWLSPKRRAAAKRIAKGAGLLAGLAGYRFEYYRTAAG
jgi:succinoglycan biosynthesis protein ExoM